MKKLLNALATASVVVALFLPWLAGVIVGAFKLAFQIGHSIGYAKLAKKITE